MKSIFKKISDFVQRYIYYICVALLICNIMQQGTISRLQQTVVQLQQQAGMVADSAAVSSVAGVQDQPVADGREAYTGDPALEGKSNGWLWAVAILIGVLMGVAYVLYRMGKFAIPFTVSVVGKLWQDLQMRPVYTLTLRNNSRKAVEFNNAMIVFVTKSRQQRKFRMPIKDLPMTLQPGTSHSFTVSIQRLMEQNPDLMGTVVISVQVEAGGKVKKTFPQGVKFGQR